MNKVISGLAVLATFVLLVGCRPTAFTSQPTPTHYLTALEAYEQIRPIMLDWHEDARVVYMSAINDEQSGWQILNNGTAAWWMFEVSSPTANLTTVIELKQEEIVVGIDGIVGYEISMTTDRGVPIGQMIDSDEAATIALRSGASSDNDLLHIRTSIYDHNQGESISLVWALTYATSSDSSQEYRILIDVVTGKVLHNDFTYTPPPPTPTSSPGTDQLLVRAYGEFDLYITNPQSQSLGIEPNLGEQIAEIPDAWYESDSDIMTENDVRLASALIANPIEGHYLVRLHGSGESEKHCRLSVEIRKGTGEETLHEVEVPCRGGVSLVYEFTLSLSGEELLSDVTPVEE